FGPAAQGLRHPTLGFVAMTACTRIGHAESRALCWCDEPESMGADVDVADGLFDFGHVTVNTFAARRACLVMSVRFQRWSLRTVRTIGVVACQAELVGRLPKPGGILIP